MKLERVKTEAAFEPALRPLYTLMAISAVCGGLLMWAMGFTITRSALSLAILPAYIVFGGMMARRHKHVKPGGRLASWYGRG